MDENDIKFINIAIEEARKCKSEDNDPNHPRPYVGVVVAKDGVELKRGHRGELDPGGHAEYTVIDRKLPVPDNELAGATVYTTLEPCIKRNHPKVHCAQRIIDRKIKKVFIGMLDPNPNIKGEGVILLQRANIEVALFPGDHATRVLEMNAEFIRFHRDSIAGNRGSGNIAISQEFIKSVRNRSLDDWYKTINKIYVSRNFHRSPASIFAHLIEVVGGLSLLASGKQKPHIDPSTYVPKAIAWWLALCGKVGVISVDDLIWQKFPGVCPYCLEAVHSNAKCVSMKKKNNEPDWDVLKKIGGDTQKSARPVSLGDWQRMFYKIYETQQTADYKPVFARLSEELGELAEAVRVFPVAPRYFLSEAADVFAWLMHVQNIIDDKKQNANDSQSADNRGDALEIGFCKTYPDYCPDCKKTPCSCSPILGKTIGRISHEVPWNESGDFLTVDKLREFLDLDKTAS
jgi:pyrimidine deaminase RibD-like protein